MRDDRTSQAREALQGLTELQRVEVLGFLTASRPEAVLAAVEELRRHWRVVAQLRQERPPGDTLL